MLFVSVTADGVITVCGGTINTINKAAMTPRRGGVGSEPKAKAWGN